jgi:microcystin-dependent protein
MAGAFSYGMTPTNSPKGSAFQAVQETIISSGSIQMFAGSTAPNGWLVCDGSTVSRKTYGDLFKILGTTYGSGNSNTTFTLPDMRGRCPIGVGTGNSLTARTLGSNVGAETATLAETNLPSHTHTATVGTQSANHTHTGTSGGVSANHTHGWARNVGSSGSYGLRDGAGRSANGTPNTGGVSANHTHATTTGNESANHTHSVTNSNTGSGTPVGIMLPSIVVNFIIKV